MLNFVLAESALELIPREIQNSPAVASDARRRGVDAARILLDRSFHHSAMERLEDSEKRGRPDLVHGTLLSVTGTPLYLEGRVKALVHTYPNLVLDIAPKTRIPKSYIRFRGLMEKALAGEDVSLVRARRSGLRELVKTIAPDIVFGLSVQGKRTELEELAGKLMAADDPCVLVGGFPHGHFTPETLSVVDELVRVHEMPLEAHVVTSRLLYEFEKALMVVNR
ncbi:MAG: ribosome biogenesis protein [Nitrososphaerota archaeon]|nr:ribosome biogenesis protein [Nitrososphaerota archaeon]MDG7024088.1 ribosome biogenesis protein [Nitrososphaerota archaeon]